MRGMRLAKRQAAARPWPRALPGKTCEAAVRMRLSARQATTRLEDETTASLERTCARDGSACAVRLYLCRSVLARGDACGGILGGCRLGREESGATR